MPDVTLTPIAGDPWNGGAQPLDPTVAPSITLSLAAPVSSASVPQSTASNPAPASQPSPSAMLAAAMANQAGQPAPIQGAPSERGRAEPMPPFADEFGRPVGTEAANAAIQKYDALGGVVASLDGFANAIPFTDRVAAAAAAATGLGGKFGDYSGNLAQLRREEGAAMSAHPVAALGGEFAGGAALPLPPVGWIGKGAEAAVKVAAEAKALEVGIAVARDTTPLWIKAARGGTVGGGIGALQGASSSPDLTNPWETAKGMAYGAAIGSAFGLLGPGIEAVANAKLDPNTAYVILGMGGVGVDLASAARAKKLLQAGVDPVDVWRRTNWFRGADGEMRTEWSDHMARLRPDALLPSANGAYLPAIYQHPSIYRAYPALTNVKYFNVPWSAVESNYQAAFYRNSRRIFLNPNQPFTQALRKVGHEIQHGVAAEEGFNPGTNPESAGRTVLRKDLLDEVRIMGRLLRSGTKATDLVTEFTREMGRAPNPKALQEAQRRTPDQIDLLPETPYEAYWRNRGEVEARNVESRWVMTRAERREKPPWTTQNVPNDKQLAATGGIGGWPSMPALDPLAAANPVEGTDVHPRVLRINGPKSTAPKLGATLQKGIDNDPRWNEMLHLNSIALPAGLGASGAYRATHDAATGSAAPDNRAAPFDLRGPVVPPDGLLPSLLGRAAHQRDAERAVLPLIRSSAASDATPQLPTMTASVDLDHSGIREAIHHVRTLKAELASLGTASVSVRHSGFGYGGHAPGAVRSALNGNFGSDGRAFG